MTSVPAARDAVFFLQGTIKAAPTSPANGAGPTPIATSFPVYNPNAAYYVPQGGVAPHTMIGLEHLLADPSLGPYLRNALALTQPPVTSAEPQNAAASKTKLEDALAFKKKDLKAEDAMDAARYERDLIAADPNANIKVTWAQEMRELTLKHEQSLAQLKEVLRNNSHALIVEEEKKLRDIMKRIAEAGREADKTVNADAAMEALRRKKLADYERNMAANLILLNKPQVQRPQHLQVDVFTGLSSQQRGDSYMLRGV